MTDTQFSVQGYVVGTIWMPAQECYKPVSYSFTRNGDKRNNHATLRDALLAVTNDGDFQSCKMADGVLIARRVTEGATRITREKVFPLSAFPSIADMVRDDWNGPDFDD